MRSIAALLALAILAPGPRASAATGGPPESFGFAAERIGRALDRVRAVNPELPVDLVRRITEQRPLFLFVPGILGSMLTAPSGKVIWGVFRDWPRSWSMHSDDVDQLAYDSTQPATPALLTEYKIIKSINVYGDFIHDLETLDFGYVEDVKVFPYDWRQDNRRSAEQLDERLRSPEWHSILDKRRVYIIAHSMGGLVTTYWYDKMYTAHPQDYPFTIAKMIFLGTPHSGATASLYTLIDGYSTSDNASLLRQAVEKNVVFDELNRVGHTFPSSYQLLPVYDLNALVFRRGDHSERTVPVFDIEEWKRFDLLSRVRGDRDPDAFYARIKPLLEDGLAFQRELNDYAPPPGSTYYYSDAYRTITRVVLSDDSAPEAQFTERGGDERVAPEAAKNLLREKDADLFRWVPNTHGDLPNALEFKAYINDIRAAMLDQANRVLGTAILGEPVVREAFLAEGALLEIPFDPRQWENPGIQLALEADYRLLQAGEQPLPAIASLGPPTPDVVSVAYAPPAAVTDLLERFTGNDRDRLLALYVALYRNRGDDFDVYSAAERLASALLGRSLYQAAKQVAQLATTVAVDLVRRGGSQIAAAMSLRTLGTANLNAGARDEAMANFARAGVAGSRRSAEVALGDLTDAGGPLR